MPKTSPFRYWLVLHPDISKPIGGVKQIHRLAESILLLGRTAVLVQDSAAFHPGWFESQIPTISLTEWQSTLSLSSQRDIIVVPETFVLHLDQYKPGIPKIIYNQNGHYTFLDYLSGPRHTDPGRHGKIKDIYRSHPDLRAILCVSRYDRELLVTCLELSADKVVYLPNIVEPFFAYVSPKSRILAFMPRKNHTSSRAVISLLEDQPWFQGWHVLPISNCTQSEVAQRLGQAQIFLSFGHPEGFGLPVAEAMASGCYCIGYTGLGGRELFLPAQDIFAAEAVEPDDWLGFLAAVRSYIIRARMSPAELQERLGHNAHRVSTSYSSEAHLGMLSPFLCRFEASLMHAA